MKIKVLASMVLMASFFMTACDDTTDTIGTSLTDNKDLLNVETDTFTINEINSIKADSVLSRSTTGYLGKIRDPETGAYVTGNFMTQFNTLENYNFPAQDSIVSRENGEIIADSCNIRLYYTTYYGDSLATMNLTAYEMGQPMSEGAKYYSNFDPEANGFVNKNGLQVNKTYTLTDLTASVSDRNSSSYTPSIKINLNKPYTKDGKTYKNYGTYIMRKYYEDPNRFKNSYNFIHEVCPGFYFKINDGLGSMAYITISQLNVYFRYKNDSTMSGMSTFAGTEEVLQTTNITNDDAAINSMLQDKTCSYLKTPAGIFTEITLPVDEITANHSNDTINSAKLTLQRINNDTHGKYALSVPTTLLMIPKDSLKTFFENAEIADYKRSFLATYSSSSNSYTFNNISGMINYMSELKKRGVDQGNTNWNKVVIIPVTTTYVSNTNSYGQSEQTLAKVTHDMSLSSTRIVGGEQNKYAPVKISVIYSKFNH